MYEIPAIMSNAAGNERIWERSFSQGNARNMELHIHRKANAWLIQNFVLIGMYTLFFSGFKGGFIEFKTGFIIISLSFYSLLVRIYYEIPEI